MKKLLLTLFALAGMASAVVASGPVSLPGFKKRVPIQRHVENRQMPTVAVQAVKLVTPPKAVMRQAPAGMEYVDRLLKEDVTLGSWAFSVSFEYDEYGFPKKTTSTSGGYTTYEYTWQVPGKIWASKKVSDYDADGNPPNVSTDIQRTFYPDGAVKTSTSRSMDGSFVIDEYDNDGHLIKNTESHYDGAVYITSYIYFPLLDSWLESTENPWEKNIVTLDGNNGYIIETWRLDNNVWRKNHETGRWYNSAGDQIGGMDLWYGDDGVQGYGEKIVVEESDNSISEIYYRLYEVDGNLVLSDGNVVWLQSSKTVYSRNYNDPWVYDAGEVRTREKYDYEDNQWVISYKETYTWVKDNVVKEVVEDYEYEEDSYTNYIRILEDGSTDSDFYYDEATGNYAIYEYDGVYDYYTYYDAAGNVISKFRVDEKSYEPSTYEQWADGAWRRCTGTITIYEGGDDTYVVTFDEQGRLVREEEYENGHLDGYVEYTYTDNGYAAKYYEPVSGGTQVYLAYEDSYTTEGNIMTYIDFGYSEDGSIEYAYKSVDDKENGISYRYYLSDGEWSLESVYVEPVEEILADGTMIRIERVLDADGKIINSSKTVDLETPDRRLSERYEWNVERGDWDGVWKNEEVKINRQPFVVIAPVSPEIFEDEYFFPGDEETPVASMDWYSIQWRWDSDSNTWVSFNSAPEYTYPDEYTQVYKEKSRESESTVTIRVDSERRMIERTYTSTMGEESSTSQQLWTYDDKGRVVSDIEHRYDGDTWTYYYTYGPVEVISGVEDVISGTSAKVTVYNLQGICVLRDAAPEAVGTLPQGLYIINGKKVVIR